MTDVLMSWLMKFLKKFAAIEHVSTKQSTSGIHVMIINLILQGMVARHFACVILYVL